MSDKWVVRRIRIGEGLRLRELRLHALGDAPTAFGSTLAREQDFPEELWHERAEGASAGPDRITLIAEQGDRWVGMATGLAPEPGQPGPVLVGMFVDGAARRLGIGEALVEGVKDWARARGDERLYLWAVASNAAALGLYRRCGFNPSGGTRPLTHTPGLTEMQMSATLQ